MVPGPVTFQNRVGTALGLDVPAANRPAVTHPRASWTAWFLAWLCVFALIAPGTCFVNLPTGGSLRLAEEHETPVKISQRHSTAHEQHRRPPVRRVPQTGFVSSESPLRSAGPVLPPPYPGHRYANGLCAPLIC